MKKYCYWILKTYLKLKQSSFNILPNINMFIWSMPKRPWGLVWMVSSGLHLQSVQGKLKVLKMPKIGKDAADFGLCFIAGQLSTQYKSSEVCFEIMSNDFSMEYVADLLKIAKFQAKVISAKPLVNPNIAQQIKAEIDIQKLIFQYCSNLVRSNFSKPAKVETLINSLKANLKVEEKYAQLLVDELIRIKLLKISLVSFNIRLQQLKNFINSI